MAHVHQTPSNHAIESQTVEHAVKRLEATSLDATTRFESPKENLDLPPYAVSLNDPLDIFLSLDRQRDGYETIAPGDYAVIRVTDTGVGIAPADLKQIFEPFFTKKHMGRSGTGLGMSVVWATVKDLDGFIDI